MTKFVPAKRSSVVKHFADPVFPENSTKTMFFVPYLLDDLLLNVIAVTDPIDTPFGRSFKAAPVPEQLPLVRELDSCFNDKKWTSTPNEWTHRTVFKTSESEVFFKLKEFKGKELSKGAEGRLTLEPSYYFDKKYKAFGLFFKLKAIE